MKPLGGMIAFVAVTLPQAPVGHDQVPAQGDLKPAPWTPSAMTTPCTRSPAPPAALVLRALLGAELCRRGCAGCPALLTTISGRNVLDRADPAQRRRRRRPRHGTPRRCPRAGLRTQERNRLLLHVGAHEPGWRRRAWNRMSAAATDELLRRDVHVVPGRARSRPHRPAADQQVGQVRFTRRVLARAMTCRSPRRPTGSRIR